MEKFSSNYNLKESITNILNFIRNLSCNQVIYS